MHAGSTTTVLRLFGAARIARDGVSETLPVERPVQLLVCLACIGDWTERDRIAALFWPEHDADAAHRNVRKLLHRLRHTPMGQSLETTGTRVRWTMRSDVADFDAALAAGDVAQAHRLYGGELAPGFEIGGPEGFVQWLRAERVRRALRHREAALRLMAQTTDPAQRLPIAQALLTLDGLDEEAALAAARAHLDLRQPAAAGALLRQHATRIASELAIEPSAPVRELLRRAALPSEEVAQAATPAAAAGARYAFVGRRAELRELLDALGGHAVVTLHGPGGIGKSRLARAAIERLADGIGWRWPLHWVALADVATAAAFGERLAAELGITLGEAPDPWAVVLQHLHKRALLLVLDNAEAVAGLSPLLAALTSTCTDVRLLVTSRVPLGLPAEQVRTLEGLPWPEDEDADDADVASRFDAVALFCARAAAADPCFELRQHLSGVVEVVRLVQGMPLAIELAAGWVRLLPPREIAAEIAASMDILDAADFDDGTARGKRREHASVRATLQRSWALLAPRERDALAALGTMRGGFTHDAARAVALASMPLLASLVDKSLVQADPKRARFDMHPLVGAFAREQAARDPAAELAAAARHAAWFAAWLQRIAPQARTDVAHFNAAIACEIGNLEQAWAHAVQVGDLSKLADMASPLANYFENSGRYREGIDWLARALSADEQAPAQRRVALLVHRGIGTLAYRLGAHERVERHARAAVRLARLLGDTTSLKAALNLAGLTLWQRNRFAEAARYLEAALRQAEHDEDRRGISVFTSNLGLVAREIGEFERSLALLKRAYAMAVDDGNQRSIASGCNNIGNHHRLFADWGQALHWLHQGLAVVEQHVLDGMRASFTVNIGLVELGRGDLGAAQRWLESTLALEGRGAEPYLVVAARLGMAQLMTRQRRFGEARHWMATAVRLARAERARFHELEAVVVLAEWHAAQGEPARAGALLFRLLAEPGLDATLRVETERALDQLQLRALASAPRPGSLAAALDELVTDGADGPTGPGGTPVERSPA